MDKMYILIHIQLGNDIFIKISTGPEFDKNDVKMIIQKAARY